MFRIKEENQIYLTRGDNAFIHVTAKNDSGDTYIPVDGDKIIFSVKRKIKDNEYLFQIIQTEHVEDGWDLIINPENTKDLSFGDYIYDIQLTRYDGWIDTIIEPSVFTVAKEVT